MGKTIESPVKRFPGKITLCDPLTYAQVAKWDEALQRIRKETELSKVERLAQIERELYPLIFEFVEKWELENMKAEPRESFPNATAGTSAASIHGLVGWLITECQNVYDGNEDSDPNA